MWQLRPVPSDEVAAIAHSLGLSFTTARMLWQRGLTTPAAAKAFWLGRDDLSFLAEPLDVPALAKAVARIHQAIADGETLTIYGDYDADGITSAALLYRYLTHGPKAVVDVYLPDRFADGYGITPQAVRRLAAQGRRLIITCDNGIAAVEAAAVANELGVDLIVTDHHHMPDVLPEAYALIHPQLGFTHLADLSGVGVALLLVIALEGGWHDRLRPMLDLVALGAIADVVPLNGPNRALVWAGLQHIRTTARLRPGLRALIDATGYVRAESLSARNIAFSLAPLLNAAGRLDKARLAFDLLVTDDPAEARRLAEQLQALNQERRELDRELTERLSEDIERQAPHTELPFLVLADVDFHHGITGIVAGRLRERFGKPVLLLSQDAAGLWKGSGRSGDGCHLYQALESCSDLLVGFGGHAQAAGCTVETRHIAALRTRLNEFLARSTWTPPDETLWLDAAPRLSDMTPKLLAELAQFEPTGQGNPAPVLGLMGARVLSRRTDKSGKHLFLRVDDGETFSELVAWGQGEALDAVPDWIDCLYKPALKEYRGQTRLELKLESFQASSRPVGAILTESIGDGDGALRLIDARHVPSRTGALRTCLGRPGSLAVYTGEHLPGLEIDRAVGQREVAYWSDRHGGAAAVDTLVMWERPASLDAWRHLTAHVTGAVYMLWETPQVDPVLTSEWLSAFTRELAALRHLPWSRLLTAHGSTTTLMVRAGLESLRESGMLVVDGQNWELVGDPATHIDVQALACYRTYQQAHAFRRLLAIGDSDAVREVLTLPANFKLSASGPC